MRKLSCTLFVALCFFYSESVYGILGGNYNESFPSSTFNNEYNSLDNLFQESESSNAYPEFFKTEKDLQLFAPLSNDFNFDGPPTEGEGGGGNVGAPVGNGYLLFVILSLFYFVIKRKK